MRRACTRWRRSLAVGGALALALAALGTAQAQSAVPGRGTVAVTGVASSPSEAQAVMAEKAAALALAPASSLTLLASPAAATQSTQSAVAGPGAGADAELDEQARALRYDVDLIYQFVHDHIETEWTYGLAKGALGTLLDGRGNWRQPVHFTRTNPCSSRPQRRWRSNSACMSAAA